jgi:hypothetical protein
MGDNPGDKLQVIHALRLFVLFPIPIADPAFPLIKGETLQGQKRPNHVLSDPLGLVVNLGPDAAVDIEPGMSPGEKALCPFGVQELFMDEKPEGRAAEIPQQPPVVLEEYPQHPWDGEDDLAVGDIQKKLFPHPFAPLLQPLGMARGAKPAGPAGEHDEVFRVAVGTADAGKSATGIPAVEIALDDLLDDGPEEAMLLLEAALILGQKTVKEMKQHSVENSALGMPRTIYSRHSGRMDSKNGPSSWVRALLPEDRGGAPARPFESGR